MTLEMIEIDGRWMYSGIVYEDEVDDGFDDFDDLDDPNNHEHIFMIVMTARGPKVVEYCPLTDYFAEVSE